MMILKTRCPHCNELIRVVSNNTNRNYLYCPKCDMRYVMDKTTKRFIAEYKPRKVIKFKTNNNI